MLVGARQVEGTIGGGQLEWQAIAAARALLDAPGPARLQRWVLAADAGQCCGGVVELWIERYGHADIEFLRAANAAAARGACVLASRLTRSGIERALLTAPGGGSAADGLLALPPASATVRLERAAGGDPVLLERLDAPLPAVWLYGAGHVGQALARILMELPLSLTWIDSRTELLPCRASGAFEVLEAADPVATVARAPAGTRFVVLTHSHALDYELCRAILGRADFTSLGLIGSASKAARFRGRLARDGVPPAAVARLACPIGIEGIASKWPAAIAVAIAAQLLRGLDVEVEVDDGRQRRREAVVEAIGICATADCGRCASGDPAPAAAG